MSSAADSACRQSHRVGRPSAEQSRELMAAVLHAAREEFATKGFHHATMDAIAIRAGVSKRTLYAWHADKEALLHAAIMERAVGFTDYVIDPKGDLKEAITAYSLNMLRELTTDYAISVGGLMMREARQFSLASEGLQQGQEYLCRPLVTLLRELGMAAGEADAVAEIYVAALQGQIQPSLVMGRPAPTPKHQHVAMVVELLLPGLEKRLSQICPDRFRPA
jgi:TetR/AcrR family transcriptional regulator, mexJK operon transcriptional repressor